MSTTAHTIQCYFCIQSSKNDPSVSRHISQQYNCARTWSTRAHMRRRPSLAFTLQSGMSCYFVGNDGPLTPTKTTIKQMSFADHCFLEWVRTSPCQNRWVIANFRSCCPHNL